MTRGTNIDSQVDVLSNSFGYVINQHCDQIVVSNGLSDGIENEVDFSGFLIYAQLGRGYQRHSVP